MFLINGRSIYIVPEMIINDTARVAQRVEGGATRDEKRNGE